MCSRWIKWPFSLVCSLLIFSEQVAAQVSSDSLQSLWLEAVSVRAQGPTISRLKDQNSPYLWSGKKSEVIRLANTDANIAEKTPRQIFAKVPGVFVYDMDGSGNQTNISTRGLDPHRGWEFNIRADGMLTNSDIYGYPASHFSLPMEAIERIELVRGTGALQYGAQFGGMLNYILKRPDTTRAIGLESIQSVGSFGLLSTYNALGGKVGKLEYSVFYSKRVSNGYRDQANSDYDGQGATLRYYANKNLVLKAQVLRSNYLYRIPGPLTDAMFEANPRQSTRSRNYYTPEIYVPSFSADWNLSSRTKLVWTASGVFGGRRSLQFDRPANVVDAIQPSTLQYGGRQVDIDLFNSRTTEMRLLHHYSILGKESSMVLGVQYFNNNMNRQQQGKGSTGTDADFSTDSTGWGRDVFFKSQNIAFSIENKFQINTKWSLSPGARVEIGSSKLSGTTVYAAEKDLANTIEHRFPLFGINTEYLVGKNSRLYAGISQAYRPVLFKDVVPANPYERVNKDLKDAFGWNAEMGWRGTNGGLKWDIGVFALQYNNRIGSLAQFNAELDTVILFRTNVGDSRTYGVEWFTEYSIALGQSFHLNLFTSTAYFHARYLGDSLRLNGQENKSLKGNHLESVPEIISRNGCTILYKGLSATLLYSYTAETFSDPFNTVMPTASGAVGKVPAYGLLDLNASYRMGKVTVRGSINNLLDKQYFTKRPTIYPGPGVWPSDGRSLVLSVGVLL